MSFPLNTVPTDLRCPECGHYLKDVDQADGFEMLVADVLQAKDAHRWNEGHDVYDSALFPGLTFQVKCANARKQKAITKTVNGRRDTWRQSPTWTWTEGIACSSDWYILFGIKDDLVYPFAVPLSIWEAESYDTRTGGRILQISTKSHSHCGRYAKSYKRNKFWEYYVRDWPEGLPARVKYYTKQPRQAALFEFCVPYST